MRAWGTLTALRPLCGGPAPLPPARRETGVSPACCWGQSSVPAPVREGPASPFGTLGGQTLPGHLPDHLLCDRIRAVPAWAGGSMKHSVGTNGLGAVSTLISRGDGAAPDCEGPGGGRGSAQRADSVRAAGSARWSAPLHQTRMLSQGDPSPLKTASFVKKKKCGQPLFF